MTITCYISHKLDQLKNNTLVAKSVNNNEIIIFTLTVFFVTNNLKYSIYNSRGSETWVE